MVENKELDKICMKHFQGRPYVADGIFYSSPTELWNYIHPKVLFVLKQPNSVVFHRVCLRPVCLRSDDAKLIDNFVFHIKKANFML